MIQEETDKLMKYLCMALPYGVKIQVEGLERDIIKDKGIRTLASVLPLRNAVEYDNHGANYGVNIEQVKPYLRPMSSMTEDELGEFNEVTGGISFNEGIIDFGENSVYATRIIYIIDWLLEHHFDYRGLIEKGLAIKVTEENNPYKN